MILVTGATGLVGSHLLYELVLRGKKVRAIRRNRSSLTFVEQIFNWYNPTHATRLLQQIEWVEGDVLDIYSLEEALKGVEQVYHCAAVVSYHPADRHMMFKINIEGTANVVNACLEAGIKKLCHCSSIAAVGRPEKGNRVTEDLIWKTSKRHSNYAISKFGAEREVWRGTEEGLQAVIVNPSVIIGPGDPSRSSSRLYASVKKGLKFYTGGTTGFVDVRDVAKTMALLMESPVVNERFILNSENLPYQKLFALFAHHIGVKPPGIKAGAWLTAIAWRAEMIRGWLTGKKPLITRETARSANNSTRYSSVKIKKQLEYSFIPIQQAIGNTVAFYEHFPQT